MTDNGSTYRSIDPALACRALGIRGVRIVLDRSQGFKASFLEPLSGTPCTREQIDGIER